MIRDNQSEPILMADPRVTTIDCRSDGLLPLASVTEVAEVSVDGRKADDTGAWRLLREPVLARLRVAVRELQPGLRLRVVEGYRPPDLQSRYFEGYLAKLSQQLPHVREEELHALASRHVSPPAIAPHSAGAAIDLTLETEDGVELDLGTPLNATPEASQGRCYTWHPEVTGEALELRKTLAVAMEAAGFVNYPTEWWHWSYGDRYWAMVTGEPEALFDRVPLGRATG